MTDQEPKPADVPEPDTNTETQEQPTEKPVEPSEKKPRKSLKERFSQFKAWYKSHKKLSIPLTVLVLVGLILLIPPTRYALLGKFMKKNVLLYTVDSSSGNDISNTTVTIDGKQPGCESHASPYPSCFADVPVGAHTVRVEAAYYEPVEYRVIIGVSKAKDQNVEVALKATGRVLSVKTLDKISGKAVPGMHVKAGDSEVISNEDGYANVVVDPSLQNVDIEVFGDGYNTVKTNIAVNTSGENLNEVSLTPAGKLYFLSKKSGKIDVVKTNLDGSERQTVLAGTGREDEDGTVLLASRDWKYLALLARRDSENAKLYLINTADDKLSVMDEGDASFTVTGWLDHHFIYRVSRNNVATWQSNQSALKGFNAESGKITTLDQTAAEGGYEGDSANEYFGEVFALKGIVLYVKNWVSYYSPYRLENKQAGIFSIKADGSGKKTLKASGAPGGTITTNISFDSKAYEAGGVYFKFNQDDSLYEYEDDKVESTSEITVDEFYTKAYPTFLQSPNGQENFWSEERDGQNTLFIGDEDGENGREIETMSEYKQYGWYTDNYLLVSINGSELFIMSRAGGAPLKVTDYHKPVVDYYGYGGGYGGI